METLRDRLIRHEGNKLRMYPDSVGKWTIGVGRNLSDRGISASESDLMLDNDIAAARHDFQLHLPWANDLPPPIPDVLIEMIFQMGVGKVLAFRQTLSALQAKNYTLAAEAMLDSMWAKETPARAQELSNLVKGAAQ